MIQFFLLSIIIVGISILGLGVNIFFRKTSFPETEIGRNKNMKAIGISCVKCGEMKKHRDAQRFKHVSLDIQKLSI